MEKIALGMAVRSLREQKQMSGKDLSLAIGLPDYSVSRIETGKTILDFSLAMKITGALGVTVNDLAAVVSKITPQPSLILTAELEEVKTRLTALRAKIREEANSI